MTVDTTGKKLEQLEKDVKLLKNEILMGIMGVHDFLSNLKFLPPHRDDGSGPDEETLMSIKGGMDTADKRAIPPALTVSKHADETETPVAPKTKPVETPAVQSKPQEVKEPAPVVSQADLRSEKPIPTADSARQLDKCEPLTVYGKEPSVNMLANLFGWISLTVSKIGVEQLPILLDVYAACGELPSRTRKIIMKLAELVVPQSREDDSPEVWSQLILQLHGILTGFYCGTTGEKDLFAHSKDSMRDEESRPVNNEKPLKLKLILPSDNGHNQELDLGEFITSINYE